MDTSAMRMLRVRWISGVTLRGRMPNRMLRGSLTEISRKESYGDLQKDHGEKISLVWACQAAGQ